MPDPRKIVGGEVWAKADLVSHDSKRIFGAGLKDKWLRGTVLEVINKKPEGAKRSTTYIVARYMVGLQEKEKELSLQSLKAENPTPTPPTSPVNNGDDPPPPPLTNQNGSSPASQGDETMTWVRGATEAPPPDSIPAEMSKPKPEATCHGREWFIGSTDVDVNGPVPRRFWKMTCQYTGIGLTPGCDDHGKHYTQKENAFHPIDFFMACFPQTQLKFMVDSTSANLRREGKAPTSIGEVLKWFGVTILITQFEFGSRCSLWGVTPTFCKYVPPAALGEKTGMSRQRYEDMLKHMCWSFQPASRPDSMSSESYRWLLVQSFVNRINVHRKQFMSPSSTICVDESMSRWYGLGGNWINEGLPQYVAIDRKPEDGCEIQNSADGMSGIMLRLKLVKSADHEKEEAAMHADDNGYLHGCNILFELVKPWANTNAVVVADSYFASVQAALRLKSIGLKFIGCIKTATREYPMHYLGHRILQGGKGDRHGVLSHDAETGTDLLAFVWVDRDRRYFISTASSLAAGLPCCRNRWKQVDKTANAPPSLVEVIVPQPEACGIYYAGCGKIDQHNRHRQAGLMLEKKIRTTLWHRRVNMSLFGMMVVDSYLLALGCQGNVAYESSRDFFAKLAEQLIDNRFEQRNLRRRAAREISTSDSAGSSGRSCASTPETTEHLTSPTPTKRFKKSNMNHRSQGRCMICKKSTIKVCRECQKWYPKQSDKQYWICDKPGKECMGQHILDVHPNKLAGEESCGDKKLSPL